jgi:anti-sigma factor RsiW
VDRGLTCRELVELVTDYLEGALPAGERERFEAHMAACEGCDAYVEQVRRTIELTRRTRALEQGPQIAALRANFRDYRRTLVGAPDNNLH